MEMTREDYEASLFARHALEKVAPKSEYGKCIEEASFRWDPNTGRVPIANHNYLLMLKTPENVYHQQSYIQETCKFLNNLNEAFKAKGYHINVTDELSGVFYMSKDKKDTSNVPSNGGITEGCLQEEVAYRHYLMNKSVLQRKLSNVVNEALIITDSSKTIEERANLLAITEGLGDSLNDVWEKFKAFLNKIWMKFSEFLTRTLTSDKNYLEKYKEIILKRQFQLDSVEIDDDYPVGITRLSQFTIMTPSVAQLEQFPSTTEDKDYETVRKMVFPEYKGGDYAEEVKKYFLGGTGKPVSISKGSNLAELYNFCFNYEKIKKVLDKNHMVLQNCIKPFKEALKTKINDLNSVKGQLNKENISKIDVELKDSTVIFRDGEETQEFKIPENKKETVQKLIDTIKAAKAPNATDMQINAAKDAGTKIFQIAHDTNIDQAYEQTKQPAANQNQTQPAASQPQSTTLSVNVNIGGAPTVKTIILKPTSNGKATPESMLQKRKYIESWFTSHRDFDSGEGFESAKGQLSDQNFLVENARSLYAKNLGVYLEAVSGLNGKTTSSTSNPSGGGTGAYGNLGNGQGSVRNRAGEEEKWKVDTNINNEDELNKKFTLYNSAAQGIFSAMLTAAHQIKADYMTVIKAHVKSYVGDSSADESENKIGVGTVQNRGMNVDSVNFTQQQIDSYRNQINNIKANNDENMKKALTQKFLEEIRNAVTIKGQGPAYNFDTLEQVESHLNSQEARIKAMTAKSNG